MNDANGQPLCIGSGFFISDDIVATNAHVIEGTGSGSAKLVGQPQTFQVLGTIAVDRHADLALLKIAGKAPALRLSPGAMPSVGDNVYVIGSPLGLEGTFSEGIISGIRKTGTDSIIQMTAPISPGSSGGPVMDSSGEVVGVSVATFKQGQNLNLAVPVSYLERMLEAHSTRVMPLQAESKLGTASASIIDGLGTRTEEGVSGGDFRLGAFREYQIRLTNKLPFAVSQIIVVAIFYDRAGKMLDFDRFTYDDSIPAGLTKQVSQTFLTDNIISETWSHGHPSFKTEIRVIGFKAGASPY